MSESTESPETVPAITDRQTATGSRGLSEQQREEVRQLIREGLRQPTPREAKPTVTFSPRSKDAAHIKFGLSKEEVRQIVCEELAAQGLKIFDASTKTV